MIPAIFLSTLLTHLCGGSAGREGAALQLAADRRPVDRSVKAIESLKEIRSQLMEIKKNIS